MNFEVEKLIGVNNKLGANMVAQGQPTQRLVYDTVTESIPVAGSATYRFFSETANKPLSESNLQEGFLDNGESLVIKSINFINDNEDIDPGAFGVFSIIVGNQEVVKKLPLPIFNPFDLHIENLVFDRATPTGSTAIYSARMLTDIVIPPETSFEVQLKIFADGGSPDTTIKCGIQGLGVLFNPNTAL